MKVGFTFRPRAWWIGAHWSSFNRRLCINIIPCCTFWIALRGGYLPTKKGWLI